MKNLKQLFYYSSVLLLVLGIIQAVFVAIELRKVVLLKQNGIEVKGFVADKHITERTEGFQTGYVLKFDSDSLNKIYNQHFFMSYDSHHNKGDAMFIIYIPENPQLSKVNNASDIFNDLLISFFFCLLLLIVGWIGVKNCDRLTRFLNLK